MALKDNELTVVKALASSPLTLEEIEMINDLDIRDVMVEHGLDHVLAEKVKNWATSEYYRHRAQNQFTRLKDDDPVKFDRPLTRSHPIKES